MTWDGDLSSVDRPDVRHVTAVTGIVGHSARAAHTALYQGMEGGLLIPDELSVDRTMDHDLGTVNYVAQMNDYLVYGYGASWYADSISWC